MAGVRDFRELGAWQRATELKRLVYALAKKAEAHHDWLFRDQLVDAAASAPANIAEGFGRYSHRDFARFVRIAKSSELEVLNHFCDAVDRGYLTAEEFGPHEHAVKKALAAANGLLRYLDSTPDVPPKPPAAPEAPDAPTAPEAPHAPKAPKPIRWAYRNPAHRIGSTSVSTVH